MAQTARGCRNLAHRRSASPQSAWLLHLHGSVQLRCLSTLSTPIFDPPPYAPAAGFFDELFEAAGARRDAIFLQQGITFDAAGPEGPHTGPSLPADLVPRVLSGDVAPIRGVYKGAAGTARHDVSVKMTRLG